MVNKMETIRMPCAGSLVNNVIEVQTIWLKSNCSFVPLDQEWYFTDIFPAFHNCVFGIIFIDMIARLTSSDLKVTIFTSCEI